ncbi:MAG TPA: 4-hydroxy-3-methylbut-2-enyl diphosphate reductase [Marinilabiliaceae bacterium]|nr:4-hydroxy-3-methylbut-2-enyl diphosphate reductase [Marinilabiliaceae bacterium]
MNFYLEEALKSGLAIEIDDKSGFCFGVSRAIKMAEDFIEKEGTLYSSGDIVHNEEEVLRLNNKGLVTINPHAENDLNNKAVLFRAHGEPPSSYQKMKGVGARVLDATCPVVIKLQERVHNAWKELQLVNGQIAIYGNKGHAEVVGLIGQTNNEAIVLEGVDDVKLLNPDKKTVLFSQTTKSRDGLQDIENALRRHLKRSDDLQVHRTICAQVGNRVPHLKSFAPKFDLLLFVAGSKSSNGKVLFEVCRGANPHSYYVSAADDIQADWINIPSVSVGVCGATSTPYWLMEEVAERFAEMWLNRFK